MPSASITQVTLPKRVQASVAGEVLTKRNENTPANCGLSSVVYILSICNVLSIFDRSTHMEVPASADGGPSPVNISPRVPTWVLSLYENFRTSFVISGIALGSSLSICDSTKTISLENPSTRFLKKVTNLWTLIPKRMSRTRSHLNLLSGSADILGSWYP